MELGGLQRSTTSYRRQGSSGLIWDDKLIAEFSRQADAERAAAAAAAAGGGDPSSPPDATNLQAKTDTPPSPPSSSEPGKIRRSHSSGGRAYRSVKVASSPIPNVDPPSPKVSTCCAIFANPKPPNNGRRPRSRQRNQAKKASKRS